MKRVLLILIAIVLLLVAAVVALPFLFKDDIVNYIKNETINGQIEFNEDISIGLISSFPDLNIGIKDIVIKNNAPFEGDTLMSLKELKATIDLMQIISGNIEVKSIDLNTPYINVLVKKDGTANYDIALPSEEEAPVDESSSDSEFSFKLSSFTISNGKIGYYDTSLVTYTTIKGLNFKMSGNFNQDAMDIQTTTSAEAFTVDFDGIKYINRAKMSYIAGLVLYLNEEKYEFKENELMLNDLALSFAGTFQFVEENMLFDLTYGLTKSDFKSLLSMVPAVFTADFAGLQANGSLEFNGFMKGLMTETEYPEFALNLAVENGAFQYPDLPSSLNNTQVKMSVTNPGGVFDKTVIEIPKCHFELDKEPFDLTLLLKNPDSDPYVASTMMGKIDLEHVANLIPLEGVSTLKGIINANLEARGNMSAIENENYEAFYAAGNLGLNNFAYQDADLPELVQITTASFAFTPQYADLSEMQMMLGKSDLKFSGKIENYMPYLFHNQELKGSMALTGNYLNVDPWMMDDSAESTDSETSSDDYEMEVVAIPENINFVFTTLIDKVKYDSYDIEKLRGEITVKDQILSFKELGINMLGGSMLVDGSYNTQNIAKPTTNFSFDMKNVSIPGLYETFVVVQELLPLAQQMTGNLSGRFSMSSTLGSDMMPVLESVNGGAKLDVDRVELEGNDIWNKAVKYLGWEEGAQKLVLTKIKPNFKIVNGDIFLDTFHFNLKNQDFAFGGKSSLNQTIDYGLDTKVPTKAVTDKAENLLKDLTKNKVNVDLADEVKVRFMITGPMEKPEFKPVILGTDGNAMNVKDAAKEAAKQLIDEGKDKAIEKTKEELRKEAEALKAQAAELRKKAEALKAEAAKLSKQGEALKAESETLRKDADAQKAKIEKEMSGLPKLARDKAMIPVNKIFDNANSKLNEANKYFDLAKKPEQEAQKLLDKADELEKQADEKLK
ncbi:AsmA family protein [bacterium]|nr:AsmA family protein [bacterium]